MTEFKVDITNCDKEPIHILGKIQGHGFLIGVDCKDQLIQYISENTATYVNDDPAKYLGKHIDEIEARLNISNYGNKLKLSQIIILGLGNGFENINPFYIEVDGKAFNLIIKNAAAVFLLEFEPCNIKGEFDVQKTIGRSISAILAESGLHSMLKTAALEIKKIIQYDRVMIYQFGEDGHGEVVAEEKNSDLKPFLGMHYPASDIPKQARELYKINLTRIISDVEMDCPAIISNQGQNASLDLTHSVLRAVSPIHIQYLKNMGVAASFSISLLSHGELWGLIACHNYSPKFIDFKAREASKLIGQILSPALEYRIGEEDNDKFGLLNESVSTLIKYIEKESDIVSALTSNAITINNVSASSGAVLVFDNKIISIGLTPNNDEIKEIVKWVIDNSQDMVFYTHRLPSMYPAAENYSDFASGLFACILSRELSEMILFFKPEQKQSIFWGGNPEKAVEVASDGSLQLSPRKSFEKWTEIVRYSSVKWNRGEIAALINLREQVIYQINRKANEIRQLNERLKLAYEELDTFSFTVSHDLRTPLSSIKSYTELLLLTNESLDDNAKKILNRINACSDTMALLIKEILNYSSYTRNEIKLEKINVRHLIEDVKKVIYESSQAKNLEFIIGTTPDISGDVVMIGQVFANLLGNAVKYSSKSGNAIVKIEGYISGNETIYTVADNGIGIDIKYHNRVFELFKRMDNVKEYEGSGVGLAIVKRIMEKHKGRIWFESQLGKGTVFYVSFNNEPIG
ncbi:MAG: GAF domain-containing protein [Paludibacter sp.]|nr:GAF domain-containing protein [Paludibacter sp.]